MKGQDKYKALTVAFWNVENLFDTIDDSTKFDEDFTPAGKLKWNTKKYIDKLDKLSQTIFDIGMKQTKRPPAVIGLAEIETKFVLIDLVNHSTLKPYGYDIIHRNSPDERGIDVAMIYRKELFKPEKYWYYRISLPLKNKKSDYTRDILTVKGKLDGETFYFIYNHWPSRRGGVARSEPNRIAAAKVVKRYVDSVQLLDRQAKIIIMGDFNDDPSNKSVKEVLGACDIDKAKGNCTLFNLTYPLFKKGIGTLAYKDVWNLFDQIIVSNPVREKSNAGYHAFSTNIFTSTYLQIHSGKFKNYPYRTYVNTIYQGGYADHFPPYLILVKPYND